MSETECPTCGRNDFASKRGMKQHHSISHGESIAGEEVTCDNCEEIYRIRKSNKERSSFCSEDCQSEWMSNIKTENHWNYNGGDNLLSCDNCCNFYTETPSRSERSSYCSTKCRDLAKTKVTGKAHPLYSKEELECENCEENYYVIKSRVENSRFCSERCKHDWLSTSTGEDHPLYEDGEHSKYKQRDWRIFSKKYRNWVGICEKCGNEENLQTHHDKPISMGGDFYNNTFTVLCSDCHYGDFYKWHPPQLEKYINQNS